MNLDNASALVGIIQGITTTIGIIVAGIWSYYVFVLARSFAPNVQIRFLLKQITKNADRKIAVISVIMKNIGRTRVRKENCWISFFPAIADGEPNRNLLSRVDVPIEQGMAGSKLYPIFDQHNVLEPEEEAIEDIALEVKTIPFLKVCTVFIGHKQKWVESAILDLTADEI